ncbi:MAG: ATP-binding protein [Gammaproteobacteria bacterium]
MIKSIRRFLLLNLLTALVLTTGLTVLGNIYLDQKDIERHLDTLLRQAALSFEALLGNDIHTRNLEQLQKNINEIPKQLLIQDQSNFIYDHTIAEKYQFQVWDQSGNLLLYSSQAPQVHLSATKLGFSDTTIDGLHWRSYTKYNSKLGIRIEVAEQYDVRDRLEDAIRQDDIYIMFVMFPLAAMLTWVIIGRGFRGISKVADEVSHRLPNYLEPVDPTHVPVEVKPLIFELNKLFLKLQQAFEREKRFTGDAAHELRTPLAALKTQIQVALKTSDLKERDDLLQNVISGVDRCTHVVQQLLTLSRLVPEVDSLADTTNINLSKLATEVIAQLVPQAIDKNIDIEFIENKPDISIQGNITALSILIRNLVDNAIRYTDQGDSVHVELNDQSEHVTLIVRDSGPGIPAELRARVFERFYRVLGNKSSGSGLGLAIVQQIAKLHKAQVKLGPPPSGKGLEVEIRFPKTQ